MKVMKFVLMFVLALGMAQLSATNGTYLNGFSPISVGRGGLSYGFYDTPTLMMNNPAAVAFLPGSSLEANFSVLAPKLHFKNSLNDKDGNSKSYPLFDLAYAHVSPNSHWIWGFGAYTQGGMGSDFTLKHKLFPAEQSYHSKFGALNVGPSLVYKGSEKVSVGVSAHLLYGMMEMWMPFSLSPAMMAGVAMPGVTFGQMFGGPQTQGGLGYQEVTAFAEMKEMSGFGYSGTISAQFKVNDQFTVGTAFSTQNTLNLNGGKAMMDMTAQFNDAFSRMVGGALAQMGINPATATPEQLGMAQQGVMQQLGQMGIDPTKGMIANYEVETDLKMPAKLGIGFSYRPSDQFTFGADVEYVMWKNGFDKMPLKLTNGNNDNINKMLGSKDLNIDFPLRWDNTVVIKLGSELKFSPSFTGRVGFVHGANPVPDQTLFPVFPAIVENHISAGFTANLSEKFAINAAYELALNNSQTTNQSILASEYVNSTSELMEHLFLLSFSLNL